MTPDDARAFLAKAEQYLSSAQDNVTTRRFAVAAGDAIHAGISAKDAIVTALTGTTGKMKDHGQAVKELRLALGQRDLAPAAERALRELVVAKPDVEYGVSLVGEAKAVGLVRRAASLVELAAGIVKRGQ